MNHRANETAVCEAVDEIRPVLFLSHEASRTGAPLVLLNLLRWLKAHTTLRFQVVLFRDGPLAQEFAALGPTITLTDLSVGRSSLVRRVGRTPLLGSALKHLWHRLVSRRVVSQQPRVVYANTVGTARLIRQLVPTGVPVILHVHELEGAIQVAAGAGGMAVLKSLANRYIAISGAVRNNLVHNHDVQPSLIDLIPSFISVDDAIPEQHDRHRSEMRRRLGIDPGALVIGGCGGTDWRKGTDLFVEMAACVRDRLPSQIVHFVWVGKILDDEFTRSVMRRVEQLGLEGNVHFPGEQPSPVEMFCGFDVFALSSREEPMGLVALEAASVRKPIVCFAGAGGMPEFVGEECGRVVTPITAEALAAGIIDVASSAARRDELGQRAFEKVRATHFVNVIAPRIVQVIEQLSLN